MPRSTATFQQNELREKLRLLEQEMERTKKAAAEASRRAEETLASTSAAAPARPTEAPAAEKKPKA
jgi:hypothetical protein